MNRRKFLGQLIGGVAAAAAVRTWPFRVYSFPSEPLSCLDDDVTLGGLSGLSHLIDGDVTWDGLSRSSYPGRIHAPDVWATDLGDMGRGTGVRWELEDGKPVMREPHGSFRIIKVDNRNRSIDISA